jgi:hypothetical protein
LVIASRLTLLIVLVGLVAGCGVFIGPPPETAPPLSSVPALPQIRIVGTISGESTRGNITEYQLEDGRVASVDSSITRRIGLPGGTPAILVLGRDDTSDWVAVVGHQVGAPGGCHVLNQLGYELGDSIAVGGVRWRKAPTFHSAVSVPPIGQAYDDGTRFCLDDMARVYDVIPMNAS